MAKSIDIKLREAEEALVEMRGRLRDTKRHVDDAEVSKLSVEKSLDNFDKTFATKPLWLQEQKRLKKEYQGFSKTIDSASKYAQEGYQKTVVNKSEYSSSLAVSISKLNEEQRYLAKAQSEVRQYTGELEIAGRSLKQAQDEYALEPVVKL